MSKECDIGVTIFERAEGGIRGIVVASAILKGKPKSVAHALLMADGNHLISLKMPSKVTQADLASIGELLSRFDAELTSCTPKHS